MAKADNAKNTTKENHATDELHVLVVDDNQMVRNIVTAYLTMEGHTVETAVNGSEGLKKFRTGYFDVVITDKEMPKMNGDKLASSIKRIAPDKPIIMMTGLGNMIKSTGSIPAGVDSIVIKPATPTDIRQALEKVMAA